MLHVRRTPPHTHTYVTTFVLKLVNASASGECKAVCPYALPTFALKPVKASARCTNVDACKAVCLYALRGAMRASCV